MLEILSEEQKNKIQMVRGIAIIMVVITHTVLWNPYEIYIRPFINPAVAIFIFLSGILTSLELSKEAIKSFYKRRLLRVVVPYTIWSIVYILFEGNYDDALIDFLTGNCCSIFYYIFVYIQLVLVTPLLMLLKKSKIKWVGYLITPLAIITEYTIVINGITITYPYNINNLFVWVSFFYLGINLRERKINNNNYSLRNNLLIVLLTISFAVEIGESLVWKSFGRSDIATSQLKLSTMVSGALVCILIYRIVAYSKNNGGKEGYLSRIIIHVGNCSFGIYLIHQLIILTWDRFFSECKLATNYWFIIESIIVLIIGITLVTIGQKVFGKKLGKYLGLY